MLSLKTISILTFFAGFMVLPSMATDANIGCNQCLGANKDMVRFGCFENCGKAFVPVSHEYSVCREYCTKFVFDHGCCSGSCPNDANTCMNNFYPPTDFTKRSSEQDRSHARDFVPPATTSSDLVVWRDGAAETADMDLVEERDLGQICCKTANTLLASSSIKLAPLFNEQRWNDDVGAGLVLVSSGIALSFACSRTFKINCLFTAPAAHNAAAEVVLGGGPLPGRDEL